jgi:thiaminase
MTENIMCMWSNKQTCKYHHSLKTGSEELFYDKYCTFCMKAKLINEVSNMNRKLDQMLTLMKKQ